jgi:hypothetical protein
MFFVHWIVCRLSLSKRRKASSIWKATRENEEAWLSGPRQLLRENVPSAIREMAKKSLLTVGTSAAR